MKKHSAFHCQTHQHCCRLSLDVALFPDAFITVEKVKTCSMGVEISQSWHSSKAHRWQPPLILWFLKELFHTKPLWAGLLWICVASLSSLAESSAFPHGLPPSIMPPISPFCLHSSHFSLTPMPYKNHPHHPMTQNNALAKKQQVL